MDLECEAPCKMISTHYPHWVRVKFWESSPSCATHWKISNAGLNKTMSQTWLTLFARPWTQSINCRRLFSLCNSLAQPTLPGCSLDQCISWRLLLRKSERISRVFEGQHQTHEDESVRNSLCVSWGFTCWWVLLTVSYMFMEANLWNQQRLMSMIGAVIVPKSKKHV